MMPPTKFAQRLAEPLRVIVGNSIHSGTSHQTAPNNHPTAGIVVPQSSISFSVTGSIVTMIMCADIASAATSHSTEIFNFQLRLPWCFTSSRSMGSMNDHTGILAVDVASIASNSSHIWRWMVASRTTFVLTLMELGGFVMQSPFCLYFPLTFQV